MNEKYDSLLEIAVSIMKRKKKPQTIESLVDEVFARKGIEKTDQAVAQFEVDFMLSGYFVYFGEDDKDNNKQLWDLKERQKSSYLDKDAGIAELNDYDDEAASNELGNDNNYADRAAGEYMNDDDEVEKAEEDDDIKEELGLVDVDSESSEMESEEMNSEDYFQDEEEEEIDEEEEEDDIEEALRKQRK